MSSIKATSIKAPTTNVPMDDVTGNPKFALYFGKRDLTSAADGAYAKGASVEQYAAQLAGALYVYTVHGNDHGLIHVRREAGSATKNKRATDARTLCAFFESHRAGKLRSGSIKIAEDQLRGYHAEILTIMIPDAPKPRAKGPNWRQECLNARAERDAALSEVSALREALTTANAKISHYQGLTETEPAPVKMVRIGLADVLHRPVTA